MGQYPYQKTHPYLVTWKLGLTGGRCEIWVIETWVYHLYMGVSKNKGTPKSSILIGFSIINHPFWGTIIFGNTHIYM